MKVTRNIYSEGHVVGDCDTIEYPNARVEHRDNSSWPRMGFVFTNGQWLDYEPDPSPDYLRLIMWGASILLIDSGGFILDGFVEHEKGVFFLEHWHVRP